MSVHSFPKLDCNICRGTGGFGGGPCSGCEGRGFFTQAACLRGCLMELATHMLCEFAGIPLSPKIDAWSTIADTEEKQQELITQLRCSVVASEEQCKQALQFYKWDYNKAYEWIRRKRRNS